MQNSVKIIRTVEMLQWVQRTTRRDNRDHHEYFKEWTGHIVNSNNFHEPQHRNPSTIPYLSKTTTAEEVHFGGF